MAQRRAPLVRDEFLLWQEDKASLPIRIGTPAWYEWLGQASTFSFESSEGTFTARKERVQRGGEYWKAYRRFRGKLLHSYLGKSEGLTFSRLAEVARLLAWRVERLEGVPIDKDRQAPAPRCRVDWGEASEGRIFYGRGEELAMLEEWIVTEGCRLLALLGMGGIGKTALAIQLARQLQPFFDVIFWRSLLNTPPMEDFLAEALAFLSEPQEADEAGSLSRKIQYFLRALRTSRCLIVLDSVESVLQDGRQGGVGHYRAGYEAYGTLLQLVGEVAHSSCLLIISREKPKEVGLLEGKHSPVRCLLLPPLEKEACQYVLQERALLGSEEAWKTLIDRYASNPLTLRLVAGTIEGVFGGSIQAFLQQGGTLLGDMRELLDQQFERVSEMERSFLYWLAIEREAVTAERLLANMVTTVSQDRLLEALDYLIQRRCWIKKEEAQATFTLQPVTMQYVTDRLIEQVYQEIASGSMQVFLSHALVKAQATDEVRQSQRRLILEPLADRLRLAWGKKGVEEKVRKMLAALRERGPRLPGYAGGNALHLLCQFKSDLSQTDFSELTIWQADLRGVDLRDVNLSRCDVSTSVFTEAFGNVIAVTFSPDGKLLAAGMADGEIRVWHVPDGKPLLACEGHANWVMAVAFSPDGARLASGGSDQTIKLWDVRTGQCLSTWRGHTNWVTSVAFSPDGTLLVSGSSDRTVKLWNPSTGQCLSTWRGHTGWVRSVAFHPVGTLLASGSEDQTIHLWNLSTGQVFETLHEHTGGVMSVAFSPDGKLLASGSSDRTVKLWNPSTGQCLSTLCGHTGWVRSVAFHPDGKLLASGSDDQSIKLWSMEVGKDSVCYLKTLQGHASSVWSIAFSPDGRMLASGSYAPVIEFWEMEERRSDGASWRCLNRLQGYREYVWSVAFHPDGKLLASGSDDQSVKLWDIHAGQCLMALRGHTNLARSVAFHPDGKLLASGSDDQSIKLWDIHAGQCLMTLQGHTNWIRCVAFSPDGKLLASGSDDQSVKLWDVPTGQCLMTLQEHSSYVLSVAFSPDGKLLASSSYDQSVKLWDVPTGQCRKTLHGHSGHVWCVTFSPDGKLLASGSDDQSVKLWDVQTGQCLRMLQGHSSYVLSVAFSPDGKLLASGSDDQSVKLWDVPTGQCRKTLHGHTSAVRSLAFNPTGSLLASGSQDETIKLWERRTGRCLSTLRGERPYERLNISGVTGLTDAEKASLRALGAREQIALFTPERRLDRDQLPYEPLGERELEVLRLVAQGASTQEIAHQLGVAISTVKTYLKGIYGKLDVHSRAQAVARAGQLTIL
jgi:WD40 repeat protein/DNA-binding CsgD family transcriptional regulator